MVKLTQTVQKGGCAAKVSATELRKILGQVRFPENDKNVLVDGGLFDDAAIYQISEELALVQTLDFFTPIVDSPRKFGEVAAANALSDVYAMGGEPKTALAILAFPIASMDNQVIVEVLQGASDKIKESGANFVGGHSIDDDTLKFGLSVTGFVNPKKVWSNSKAQAGDHLILTKALGTGSICAGLKRQEFSENDISEALDSMASLNKICDLLSDEEKNAIHAATDITGFGLLGHAQQMALASQKVFQIQFSELPVFSLAWTSLQKGFLTKAHRTNAEYTATKSLIKIEDSVKKLILFDPQTSGGLLLSVTPELSQKILSKISHRFPNARKIGEVSKVPADGNQTSLIINP